MDGLRQVPAVKLWKCLLLVCPELEVRLGRERKRFHHFATEREVRDAVESFAALPRLVSELTNGLVELESETRFAQSLRSLTRRAPNEFWPSPDDLREELDFHASRGKFDSLFIFWPQHDFARGDSVPGSAWGLGMGASDWSNGATYAAVANASSAAWQNEVSGEVWLHEWLHGVCHHFAQRGHAMPERDADGAELHGYVRSPTAGWTEYYRDLMSGNVFENGKRLGIVLAAWNERGSATAA